MDGATGAWFDREIAGCSFADERLNKRLRNLLERMGDAIGASIPLACQDWANTKAAYRFFSNDRFNEAEILAGHFQSTQSRFAATEGPILVLQDTTEFSYQRERPERIGLTYRVNSGKDKAGRFRMHTVCGLLMHSSLAVTTEGLPSSLSRPVSTPALITSCRYRFALRLMTPHGALASLRGRREAAS